MDEGHRVSHGSGGEGFWRIKLELSLLGQVSISQAEKDEYAKPQNVFLCGHV